MKLSHNTTLYLTGALAVLGVIISTTLFVKNRNQQDQIVALTAKRDTLIQEIKDKTNQLTEASSTINQLKAELANLKNELDELADNYRDEKNRNDEFEDQIRKLSGTLGTLDKLAKTDKELLAKYSKVYFLNENYYPERLKQIDDKYVLKGKGDQYFHAKVIDHLYDMLKAAKRDGVDLKIVSAYRSFDEQSDLKGRYVQIYGEGANTFSADQGYSEHQLGTTVDLTTTEVGGTYESFKDTEAYKWLQKNAYKYGFILSYPEDNEFYVFEPWHWRYVGTDLARYLHRHDKTFYEMDQRKINEYLVDFFD